MDEQQGGIKDSLNRIEKLLSEQTEKKKQKKFKIKFGARVSPLKAKKNYITIQKINENGNVDFKRAQIEDQTIMEDDIPRLAGAGYVMYYKKNPLIILPSWSVEPISPNQLYQESLNNGSNTKGYKLLLNKMKLSQAIGKKQISGLAKWIFGLVILAIIGYAFISGGI